MSSNNISNSGLDKIRVLELCDERGEFCGKLLSMMGAEVIKIEPPGGSATRKTPPFFSGSDKSLYFELYNQGKKSITLDLSLQRDKDAFKRLVEKSDVLVESNPPGFMKALGLDYDSLSQVNKGLIMASITPFGQDGPWGQLNTSDLVSMALGGVSQVCGYDPVNGQYDTPPITPNWGHSFHLGSIWAAIGILSDLIAREEDGEGDYLDVSIHEAVNSCTEYSLPFYIYNRLLVMRQEARHSLPSIFSRRQFKASDGKYVCSYQYTGKADFQKILKVLQAEGLGKGLEAPEFLDDAYRLKPENSEKITAAVEEYVSRHKAEELYSVAQANGLAWGPVRLPEDILVDPHHRDRDFFANAVNPSTDKQFEVPGSPFISSEVKFQVGRPAPGLGQNNREILEELSED